MFADSNMRADVTADMELVEGGDDDVELVSQPITPSNATSTCAGEFIFNI